MTTKMKFLPPAGPSVRWSHSELGAKKERRDGSSRGHEGLGLLPLKGERRADGKRGWWGWKKGRRCSDRQRELSRPLEPADRLASPPIRHASVDEARLDVSMTEVIRDEVDRLAGVGVVISISECTRRHVGARTGREAE
jgi:hypothetical protein